jgi:2-polyprenyl-3-methyl-5-hydroxy-6-metoxy-1,4-benzoquinol methylase
MRSDRKIVHVDLEKYLCSHCGLVYSRALSNSHDLQTFYSDEYTLSEQSAEYFFYTPEGPLSRSSMFCNWIVSAMGGHHWRKASRCLEVGAGSGLLVREFIRRFPSQRFEGIELNKAAVAFAQERGLPVRRGEPETLDAAQYDIIYSVAVLEHVDWPTDFICSLHRALKPGGLLFLCQPTQDVPSYDLFFSDHLYHFGTEHLREYACKTGFRELGFVVGYEWMPNYSLHLWRAIEPASGVTWQGPPGFSTCAQTARDVLADMARLDELLADLSERRRRVAVFGLNEVYSLTCAYSGLSDFPVVCGLDDEPDKAEYATLPFPVVRPEQCVALNVQDVILTMNKVYYEQVEQRLKPLGLSLHPVLS